MPKPVQISAKLRQPLRIVLLLACLCMAFSRVASASEIGAAVVVVNHVTGALGPDKTPTALRAGIDVFQDEIVKASDDSAARVVFQDKTTLEVAPKSEIVLDRFVFDPDPALSKVAVSVLSGVTRFTTGNLPKENYSILTPGASLSVRGTILDVYVDQLGGTTVHCEEGEVHIFSGGQTAVIHAGQTSFAQAGGTPSFPTNTPFPSRLVNQLFTLLQQATVTQTGTAPPTFQATTPSNDPPTTTTNNCVTNPNDTTAATPNHCGP